MPITVRKRTQGSGGWEVDIMITATDGTKIRKRLKSPVSSKSGSLRWAEERARSLALHGDPKKSAKLAAKEVPTLAEFAPRYIEGYARANRQKPSSIDSKLSHLSAHLVPRLGHRRLDEISDEDIQLLKAGLANKANKTVNNVLTTLNTLLGLALQWKVIDTVPTIKLLRVTRRDAAFYGFDEYARLVKAARKIDQGVLVQVLLGGDAGLRPGEVRALHWTSIDFDRQQLTVERSEYKGEFTLPKHDKIRRVPMTDALTKALKGHRHLCGPLVVYRDDDGGLLTARTQRYWLGRAQALATLPDKGPHTLRHTFCSHLAMRGAPTKAIQELAGHRDLATTQQYMHLSPATLDAAIDLLNPTKDERPGSMRGGILEQDRS